MLILSLSLLPFRIHGLVYCVMSVANTNVPWGAANMVHLQKISQKVLDKNSKKMEALRDIVWDKRSIKSLEYYTLFR